MSDIRVEYDVVVAGAGVGGVSAALGAARAGASVLLLERMGRVGGTGVHSPVGILCGYRTARDLRPVNLGVLREFHPWAFERKVLEYRYSPTYDEKKLVENYERLLGAEARIELRTAHEVVSVTRKGRSLSSVDVVQVQFDPSTAKAIRISDPESIRASFFIDSTANGNLSALAGAEFQQGREEDGGMQPATLTFKVSGIDFSRIPADEPFDKVESREQLKEVWEALNPLYQEAKRKGLTSNRREDVLCFQYPDGKSLLFNQTRVLGVDPTDPESLVKAHREGEKQIHQFFECIRKHPAFEHSHIESISPLLGVREGRRIVGDHMLTEAECLAEARFDDMVAACAYAVDIHNPSGEGTVMKAIPGSGYYHIPRGSLVAKGFANLMLGSRCISGTHEAHSSYRVMAPLSAIGQAAGVNAALAARLDLSDVREVAAAQVRWELERQGAFVEGALEKPLVE